MRTNRSILPIVVGVLASGFVAVPVAQAAPGDLDPSFGTGGIAVTTNNGPAPADAILQPDGKIVVIAGFDNDPTATEAFGVLRYSGNGSLDPSFGTGGRAKTAFTNFINSPNDEAIQPDGKIVVAGETESADGTLSEFAVARFNPNGTLDRGFGVGGQVTTNFVGVQPGGVRNPATSVLVQADGKILVGGSASQCARCGTRTALARYNPDGSPDSTFGTGGQVSVTAIGAVHTLGEDAAGDIVALNGALSAGFSPTGVLQPQATPSAITLASSAGFQVAPAIFQPDGAYLVATTASDGNGLRRDVDTQVVRRLPSGAVDPSFTNPPFDFTGTDTPNTTDVAQAIARQPDGRTVVAGLHSFNGSTTFTAARLDPTGHLDTTFGTGGTLTTNLAGGGQAAIVLIQPDGKILILGQQFGSGSLGLVLTRYQGR